MADNQAWSGKNSSVLIGKEGSYGSPGTCNKDIGFVSRLMVTHTEEKERIPSIGSRNAQFHVRTRYRVNGTADIAYQHGRLLEYAIGTVGHTGASDPYTHTYTEADVLPSFTMQAAKSFTSTGRKSTIAGCKIDNLRISAEKNSALKMSMDWIGQTVAMTTTTASQTLDDILPPTPAGYAVYTGATGANPTDELPGVQAFELNIANNLKPKESFNSVLINELIAQDRNYSGRLVFACDDDAQAVANANLILGTTSATAPADTQTRRAIKFYWTNGLTPVDTLTLTLYGATFDTQQDPYESGDIMYWEVPFVAESLGAGSSQDDIASASW